MSVKSSIGDGTHEGRLSCTNLITAAPLEMALFNAKGGNTEQEIGTNKLIIHVLAFLLSGFQQGPRYQANE